MRAGLRLSGVPITLAFVAALAGCASPPMEHFYTVSSENAVPDTGAQAQRIVVSPVVIPALIDRPQLVVRTNGHEITVLENHRWAEPLSIDLARTLVNDLRRLRPGIGIVAADAPGTQASGLLLDVTITELVSGPGATTSLEASWMLHDRPRNCVEEGSFEATIPTQAGYGAIPTAYADAMSRLADAIARTIPEGNGQQCQISAGSRPSWAGD